MYIISYLVPPTIWCHTLLYHFIVNINSYEVKMSMLYSVQTTSLTFVSQHEIHSKNIMAICKSK